jgi:hypothetical protein
LGRINYGVVSDDPRAAELEAHVGHPVKLWEALKERVQADALHSFADVEGEWLALMWALDTFRSARVAPRDMKVSDIDALNRGKGNWFAELLALLLQNRTSMHVGSRTKVQGFSQLHQIDVAWPARKLDPLICAETKVTGGPPYGERPARGAIADYSNRRKELKFTATDLKLYRRQQETTIEHWDAWRTKAPPKVYFLWGARLRLAGESSKPPDTIQKMEAEARALIDTYMEGAGIFAWRRRGDGAYETVPLPSSARVTDLDDVLYRIASEIKVLAPTGAPPLPVVPEKKVVEPEELAPDEEPAPEEDERA